MDKNTKYRLEQKFQLKQDRKECPRMTKEEKENLLALLDGDTQSVEVGKIMIEKYLKLYPAEKKFAKRYKQKLSSMVLRYKSRRSGNMMNILNKSLNFKRSTTTVNLKFNG